MNRLVYKTGELYIDNQKIDLTNYENRLLRCIADGKLKSYSDIYYALYQTKVQELYKPEIKNIQVITSRIRNKSGLRIIAKPKFGMRLENRVEVI